MAEPLDRVKFAEAHVEEISLIVAELRRRNVSTDNVVLLLGPLADPIVRSIAVLVYSSRGHDVEAELARLARAADPFLLEPFNVDQAIMVLQLGEEEVEAALRAPSPDGKIRCLCFDRHGADVCHLDIVRYGAAASA